jgi:phage-related holin
MESNTHFDIKQFQHVFEQLGQFFHLKLLFALLFTFFSWSFDGSIEILITIFTLISLDTITGTGIAIRNKFLDKKGLYVGDKKHIFSSRGIYRGPIKVVVYALMVLVSRLADKHVPLHVFSPMMDTFLVSTEVYSILENFAKMGFSVPTTMIGKLKLLAGAK